MVHMNFEIKVYWTKFPADVSENIIRISYFIVLNSRVAIVHPKEEALHKRNKLHLLMSHLDDSIAITTAMLM